MEEHMVTITAFALIYEYDKHNSIYQSDAALCITIFNNDLSFQI
jgi:hypothetical protein